MRSLKGSDASRWRRLWEESAAVSWERRDERGVDSDLELDDDGVDEALGRVRACAMLQALAPRSRT